MTKRTQESLRRRWREIEDTDDKGNVLGTHLQKRTVVLPAEERVEHVCQCGKKQMVSIGQTVTCRHDGFTRKERREARRKYGKNNMTLGPMRS